MNEGISGHKQAPRDPLEGYRDPAIKELEQRITRLTNQHVVEAQKGKWGEIAKQESSGTGYSKYWQRDNLAVSMREYDQFILFNPDKAAELRGKISELEDAFARQVDRARVDGNSLE